MEKTVIDAGDDLGELVRQIFSRRTKLHLIYAPWAKKWRIAVSTRSGIKQRLRFGTNYYEDIEEAGEEMAAKLKGALECKYEKKQESREIQTAH